jgi:hypothetical protein
VWGTSRWVMRRRFALDERRMTTTSEDC